MKSAETSKRKGKRRRSHHDPTFYNFRDSKSGYRLILCSSGALCDGFWSSRVVKESVGYACMLAATITFLYSMIIDWTSTLSDRLAWQFKSHKNVHLRIYCSAETSIPLRNVPSGVANLRLPREQKRNEKLVHHGSDETACLDATCFITIFCVCALDAERNYFKYAFWDHF